MPRIETSIGALARPVLAIAALAVMALPAQAQQTGPGLRLDRDQPIQIESDRLEVNENESIAIFSGNVNVVQGATLLKSGKMTVHYSEGGSPTTGSSDIERIEVDGKVYVKTDTQTATGDRGTFDMRTEVMVLTGKEVVLTDGPNVVVGCKLTVQMQTGLSNLDGCGSGTSQSGRVKVLMQPSSSGRQ